MEAEQFLGLVLAQTGYKCIAIPAPTGKGPKKNWGFWHFVADTNEEALKIATREVQLKRNVFFAVGTLKQRSVINPGTGKKSIRKGPNISHFRCWIADLDVGVSVPGKPPKYDSQADAITHIRKFCKDAGLPLPMLVDSGYGIHAYWVSTVDVPVDMWRQVAARFKILMHAHGVRADPSRTSDVASVLRVVGTFNFKTPENPQPIKVLHETPPIDPAVFSDLVKAAGKAVNAPEPAAPRAAMDTGLGSFDTSPEPADMMAIARQCAQIKQVVVPRGNVGQALWFRALQVIRLCKFDDLVGDALCHRLSEGHPEYTAAETDEKIQQVSEYGPTLCTTFEETNPGGCTGCPHKGKINSPITLGRNMAEAEAPKMEILGSDGEVKKIDLPNPPDPWVRTANGQLGMKMTDPESGHDYVSVFYDYDIHPVKRLLDDTTGHEIFYFRAYLPKDGWREFEIPANMVYDEKQLLTTIASRGVLPDFKNKGLITSYMHAYMKHLQQLAPAEAIYSQMGWKKKDTEFILGDTSFKDDGTTSKVRIDSAFKPVLSNFESKGTLADWQDVINIYKEPGHEDLALALMIGFGAPMFHFSGFEGGVFSLNGRSGAGKSTILSVIHSIYGKPTCNVLLRKDTGNSKAVILSAYNNIPVTFDEITSIGGEEASQLVFDVTDGRDKQRLNSDASLKNNIRTWGLVLFTTTNRSLPQTVLAYKPEASGEMMRIMERRINPLNRMDFADARRRFAPLQENYGLAGGPMVQWYVQYLKKSKKLLSDFTDELSAKVNGQVPERFWLSMCATGLLGCHVGNETGVHDFSMDATFSQCCIAVEESRQTIEDHSNTGVAVLTDFINNHIGQMVIVMEQTSGPMQIRSKPRGDKLCMRSELGSKALYIDIKAMLKYCADNGHDFGGVQKELLQSGVIIRPDAMPSLVEGTDISGGRTKSWMIDTTHSLLVGAVPTLVGGNKQPSVAVI